jgi:hypothetical protein
MNADSFMTFSPESEARRMNRRCTPINADKTGLSHRRSSAAVNLVYDFFTLASMDSDD